MAGRAGSVGFIGNFCMSFPVSGVNGLGKFPEGQKGLGLIVMDHIVLDIFCEATVSSV